MATPKKGGVFRLGHVTHRLRLARPGGLIIADNVQPGHGVIERVLDLLVGRALVALEGEHVVGAVADPAVTSDERVRCSWASSVRPFFERVAAAGDDRVAAPRRSRPWAARAHDGFALINSLQRGHGQGGDQLTASKGWWQSRPPALSPQRHFHPNPFADQLLFSCRKPFVTLRLCPYNYLRHAPTNRHLRRHVQSSGFASSAGCRGASPPFFQGHRGAQRRAARRTRRERGGDGFPRRADRHRLSRPAARGGRPPRLGTGGLLFPRRAGWPLRAGR